MGATGKEQEPINMGATGKGHEPINNMASVEHVMESTSGNKDTNRNNRNDVRKNRKATSKNRTRISLESRPNKVSKMSRRDGTLFIIGDSHVRYLQTMVQKFIVDSKVIVRFQGGASLLAICSYLNETLSDEDHIFVFGGTNDVDRNRMPRIQTALMRLLKRYSKVKMTFILVPLRVYWNREYYQNNAIVQFNDELVVSLWKMNHGHLNYLDINQILYEDHYSRDGLHLNREGKKVVAAAIAHTFQHNFLRYRK